MIVTAWKHDDINVEVRSGEHTGKFVYQPNSVAGNIPFEFNLEPKMLMQRKPFKGRDLNELFR